MINFHKNTIVEHFASISAEPILTILVSELKKVILILNKSKLMQIVLE